MGVGGSIRAALVRAGLMAPPLEPHDFERDMHLLYRPAPGPSVSTVPHIVTPTTSSERCARDGCGRPPSDSIHHVADA